MDKMKEVFQFQKQYQKTLSGVDLPSKNVHLMKEFAMGIYTELGEALAVDKSWKSWRKDQKTYNKERLNEEIADIWNFLINFTLANDLDYEDIVNIIQFKQGILLQRVKDGEINVDNSRGDR